ncbi:hypothetical protein ACO0LO_00340 [Undibacterium sp. TJN25]|uniref:hypothetical protein n=1 Tax=Undibacterium sp. TJN25 TaxID=3413056 RepID=UPI003BF0989B
MFAKNGMDIRRLKFIFLLLLQAASVTAFAEPGRFGNFFSFGKSQAPEQKEAQLHRAADKKMEKESIAEEHAENKRLPAASPSAANTETNQKRSRMTPDERRALRRQINEAGHDIYVPGR